MKLKCDLIIQNLNNSSLSIQPKTQEKLHKSALISLYRHIPDENLENLTKSSASSAAPLSQSNIVLTVETKTLNLKYKLKRVETFTKFIAEGKATLKLIDENIYLLISNTTSLTLTNFISFLNIKMVKSTLNQTNEKHLPQREEKKTYANKLLNNAQFSVGKNALSNISPLCEKEINDMMKLKASNLLKSNGKYSQSPVRAGTSMIRHNTFTGPVPAATVPAAAANKPTLKRSISSILNSDTEQESDTRPSKLTRQLSSSSNLLVQLTDEQKKVLKAIKDGKNVFFTGSGGSGKSFLISFIRKSLNHDTCFVTASTGVAASLIGGITLHAFAGIAANTDHELATKSEDYEQNKLQSIITRIMNAKDKLNNWKKCKHLIIDEISMIDADLFEQLDKVARHIKNKDVPFGGIQIILSGDFLQLPPVSKYREEKKRFCFQSKIWNEAIDTTIELTQIKRQSDSEFIDMLEEIRFGKCSKKTVQMLENNKNKVFSNKEILPTKLCTHKDDVELINKKEIDALKNESIKFKAVDSADFAHSTKLLNKLCPAPEELTLKVNTQVMLIKNLSVSNNLVNGSRGYVIGFSEQRLPIVKFMNGTEMTVKYDSWSFRVNSAGLMATRRQIPLQLAWAMSIHKSQGMTLDCVELSLSRVFEYGQAYVALSRAKSLENLRIIDFDVNAIKADETVLKFYQKLKQN